MMRLIGRSNRLGRLSSPDRQTDHQVIHLNVGRCFLDSLDAIKAHPALFAGASLISVLLAAASGMLLIGSLCAGLLVMFLKAMEGKQPALADLFGPFPHFPRFLFIVVFCLGITIAGLVGTFLPVILINGGHSLWSGEFPRQVYGQIVQFSNASRGYRLALFLLVTGAAYLLVPRSFVGARCLYMLALAADQKLPADEAYMASKRAAQNYGFPQHALLTVILLWVGAAGLEGYAGLIKPWAGLLGLGLPMFLLQPLALGLLASAYRQTLQVEAHRRRLREEHVVEMRDELQMAREMQMGLLPAASPDIKGYEVGDICIPANAVCGDYYTYHWLDDRYFVIVVADVCGKAMRAAVTALRFNEMLRYECRDRTDAAEILAGLDTSLEGQLPDHAFITCCIAVLDTRTHTVEMANAGHSEPYLFSHARQEAEAVPLRGHPLGLPRILRMDKGRKKARIELRPGDWLVLYSDGVTDAFNETGEQYGEGRLVRHLNRSAVHLETSGMIDHLVQDLERHMGNAPQSDDISLIVLKRQPEIQRPGRPEKANATSGGPEMHRTPLEDKACS